MTLCLQRGILMRIDILTLFPEMVDGVLSESIIGRARKNGYIEINCINIRDFSKDKHRRVDDYPYGGGTGMVMQAQPIYDACQSVINSSDSKPVIIYMSPQGKVFNQKTAKKLAQYEHIVLLCGHYEGVDERIIEEVVDFELSVGDYVLTGGELPAIVVADCVSRLVPGVLANADAYTEESHYNGLLEYPQYTRPLEFMGRKVPEVLLSGHHKNIAEWRREQSILRTKQKRPDLLGEDK